jgi:hypothetical protein
VKWPTGGVVVVVVDVEGRVLVDVEVLLVVLLMLLVVVLVVLVPLVVGAMVVVVDVVVVDDSGVLVPAGGSVAGEGELVCPEHPVARRTRVMTGRVANLLN